VGVALSRSRPIFLIEVMLVNLPTQLSEFIDPKGVALLMWDMQNGLAGKALNVHQVKANAQRLLAAAEPLGIPVFWSQHVLPSLHHTSGPFLLFLMKKQKVTHPSLLKETMKAGGEDTAFLEGLQPQPHHIVIPKSQPSLFVDTPFDLRLKTLGIKTLVIAGVATDIGVEFNCRHAAALGYFTVVAEDACGSYTQAAHDRSIEFLRSWTTPVVRTQEIVDAWSR
jgi:nicotinamidase-related amidase